MTIKDLPCGCRQRDDITAWRCAYHSGDEDGYQRGLAERDAEVARLREVLDEAQTLIRSAAPLSWAAGTTLEQNAYEWEKASTDALAKLDEALAATDQPKEKP